MANNILTQTTDRGNSLTRRQFNTAAAGTLAGAILTAFLGEHTAAAAEATTTGQEPPVYPQEGFDSVEALEAYIEQLNNYLLTQAAEVAGLEAESLAQRMGALLLEFVALSQALSGDSEKAVVVKDLMHLNRDTALTWAACTMDIFRGYVPPEEIEEIKQHTWGLDYIHVPPAVFKYLTNMGGLGYWILDVMEVARDRR